MSQTDAQANETCKYSGNQRYGYCKDCVGGDPWKALNAVNNRMKMLEEKVAKFENTNGKEHTKSLVQDLQDKSKELNLNEQSDSENTPSNLLAFHEDYFAFDKYFQKNFPDLRYKCDSWSLLNYSWSKLPENFKNLFNIHNRLTNLEASHQNIYHLWRVYSQHFEQQKNNFFVINDAYDDKLKVFESEIQSLKAKLKLIDEKCDRPNFAVERPMSSSCQISNNKKETKPNKDRVLQSQNPKRIEKSQLKKKRVLCLYSDKLLYEERTLKKLESDLFQEYDIESLYVQNFQNTQIKTFDKVFFFYFLSAGRTQDQYINEMIERISKLIPGIPLHLIILKDAKCDQDHIDLRKIAHPEDRIKKFKIFDESYAKYVLYTDKPIKSMKTEFSEIKSNYENLIKEIKCVIDGS